MNSKVVSPLIQRIVWGKIQEEGLGVGKDVKLWPGGGRPWDWRETGTQHVPGIQISDVTELVDGHDANIVVLSQGMQLVLRTCPEALDFLKEASVAVHVLETRDAAKMYNSLSKAGERVAGLFHSTC